MRELRRDGHGKQGPAARRQAAVHSVRRRPRKEAKAQAAREARQFIHRREKATAVAEIVKRMLYGFEDAKSVISRGQ